MKIYVAAFGSHFFMTCFVQGWGGGAWPLRHSPGSATESSPFICGLSSIFLSSTPEILLCSKVTGVLSSQKPTGVFGGLMIVIPYVS